jgi:hypothetical protein
MCCPYRINKRERDHEADQTVCHGRGLFMREGIATRRQRMTRRGAQTLITSACHTGRGVISVEWQLFTARRAMQPRLRDEAPIKQIANELVAPIGEG